MLGMLGMLMPRIPLWYFQFSPLASPHEVVFLVIREITCQLERYSWLSMTAIEIPVFLAADLALL